MINTTYVYVHTGEAGQGGPRRMTFLKVTNTLVTAGVLSLSFSWGKRILRHGGMREQYSTSWFEYTWLYVEAKYYCK